MRKARLALICLFLMLLMSYIPVSFAEPVPAKPVPEPIKMQIIQEPTEEPTEIEELAETEALVETEEPEPILLGEFKLTAYCHCVKCCGIWSAEHPSRIGTGYVQKTSSGTIAQAGRTVAVDPSVIPYGTVLIINGREYVAEDSGGVIKGNRLDIYFDSHESALAFGVQTANVYMKGE